MLHPDRCERTRVMDISCRLAVAFALFFASCPDACTRTGTVRLAQRVGQRRTGRNPRGRHGHGVVPRANRRRPARDHEREGSVAVPGAGPGRVRPGGRAGAGLRGLSGRRHQHRRGRRDRSAGSAASWRALPSRSPSRRARASSRARAGSRRGSGPTTSRRSPRGGSACSTRSGARRACRRRRRRAAPSTRCPRSDRA